MNATIPLIYELQTNKQTKKAKGNKTCQKQRCSKLRFGTTSGSKLSKKRVNECHPHFPWWWWWIISLNAEISWRNDFVCIYNKTWQGTAREEAPVLFGAVVYSILILVWRGREGGREGRKEIVRRSIHEHTRFSDTSNFRKHMRLSSWRIHEGRGGQQMSHVPFLALPGNTELWRESDTHTHTHTKEDIYHRCQIQSYDFTWRKFCKTAT